MLFVSQLCLYIDHQGYLLNQNKWDGDGGIRWGFIQANVDTTLHVHLYHQYQWHRYLN